MQRVGIQCSMLFERYATDGRRKLNYLIALRTRPCQNSGLERNITAGKKVGDVRLFFARGILQ